MSINHLYVLSFGNIFNLTTRAAVYLADISSLVKCLLVHRFQRFDHTRQVHQFAGQGNAIYSYNTMSTISCRQKDRRVWDLLWCIGKTGH